MIRATKAKLNRDAIKAFLMSEKYPLVIAAMTAVGSITGTELYLGMIHALFVFVAFLICDSVRPFLISLLTFVMQISVAHSPFHPSYSDYYYTGWRIVAFIAIPTLVIIGACIFAVKNRIYRRVSFKNTPLLLPIILLSFAFLMNGVFSGKWSGAGLLFGFVNAVVYGAVFILIYHGFSDSEDPRGIADYFAYISMLVTFVIIAELTALFLTSDTVIVNGSINKVEVSLGWGIWNLIGISLAVLIPVLFYGVYSSRHPWLYFATATLALVFAALTMSRNALIFSSLSYVACALILCFKGERQKAFRAICAIGTLGVILIGTVFFDSIRTVLLDYFERGLSDNGRYNLWKKAFANFLESPIFGGGFYGFEVDDSELYSFGPLAKQAHNTVLQLLSATGVVGLTAYVYYRIETVKPIIRRPSVTKTFMAISMAVLLGGSLLDNFVFNVYPMFHYTVALTVIYRSADRGE